MYVDSCKADSFVYISLCWMHLCVVIDGRIVYNKQYIFTLHIEIHHIYTYLQTGLKKGPVRAECDSLVTLAGVLSMSIKILPPQEKTTVLVKKDNCFSQGL